MGSPKAATSCAGGAPALEFWQDPEDQDLDLDTEEMADLRIAVRRLVCSDPWYRRCMRAVIRGDVRRKNDQGKELSRKRVYPPGGEFTGMVRCCYCDHWAPPARQTRTRTAKPQKDGSVTVTFTPWLQICIDCYYCSLPLKMMVHVPTSPGFTTRIKDDELAGHFGTMTDASGKTTLNGGMIRRRYLGADGTVREPFRGDDGFDYENVFEVIGSPAAAETAAA